MNGVAPGQAGPGSGTTKALVVYDVQVKTPDVQHVPLIVNYGEHILVCSFRSRTLTVWLNRFA
jgi:hypothetical protein